MTTDVKDLSQAFIEAWKKALKPDRRWVLFSNGTCVIDENQFENIKKFLEQNPRTCFVAEEYNQLVGTVLGGNDGRRGYIYHLAVHPDHQKKGVGKQLTETCLAALRKQGIMKCHIFVISDNEDGIQFWKKIGWEMRDDILVMSRNL